MRNDLPENCFATLPSTGELIILNRCEAGFCRSDLDTGDRTKNQELADQNNRRYGINPAQVTAMQIGSMCGFDVPGANPQTYLDKAKYIRSYELGADGMIKHPTLNIYSPVEGKLHQYQVAGKDSFYLEPSVMPEGVMGTRGCYVVQMDMVQGRPLVPVSAEWSIYETCSMKFEPGSFAYGEELTREMNAGYQLIAKVQVGPVEYALGVRDGKFPSFVTWERTPANDGDGPPNYYWGHYVDSRDEAIRDFCNRASEKYEMLTQNRKPSIKAQLAAKRVPGDKPAAKPMDREVR